MSEITERYQAALQSHDAHRDALAALTAALPDLSSPQYALLIDACEPLVVKETPERLAGVVMLAVIGAAAIEALASFRLESPQETMQKMALVAGEGVQPHGA